MPGKVGKVEENQKSLCPYGMRFAKTDGNKITTLPHTRFLQIQI